MANPHEGWKSRGGPIQSRAIGGMVEIIFPTKHGPAAVRITDKGAFDLAAGLMSQAIEAERQQGDDKS